MIITVIKCRRCGDEIFSRCQYDMQQCSCKSCGIDGGFEYTRIIGEEENYDIRETSILEKFTADEVKKILYEDWKINRNKFGKIRRRK